MCRSARASWGAKVIGADVDGAVRAAWAGGPWRRRPISSAHSAMKRSATASSTSTRSVRMQTWPLSGEAAPDGGPGGAREIGVGEDDHRGLAPQLQHRRDQPLAGGAGDLPARRRRCR